MHPDRKDQTWKRFDQLTAMISHWPHEITKKWNSICAKGASRPLWEGTYNQKYFPSFCLSLSYSVRDLKCLTVGASCLGENAPLCLSLANSHQSVSLSFIRRATLFCLESLFCAFLHAELQEAFQWVEFQLVCHLSLCFGASACLSFLVPVLFGASFFSASFFGASACLSFLVPVFWVPVHVLVF